MVIIASLHLYANETYSMDDSIEVLHELMYFFLIPSLRRPIDLPQVDLFLILDRN